MNRFSSSFRLRGARPARFPRRAYSARAARRWEAAAARRALAFGVWLALACGFGYVAALLQLQDAPGRPGAVAGAWGHAPVADDAGRSREIESSLLIRKVAALEARLARVEAVGDRMIEDYGLDSAEFNFPDAPGVGGIGLSRTPATVDGFRQSVNAIERKFSVLEDVVGTRQLSAEMRPFGWPVRRAMISSGYGARHSPFTGNREFHAGVDIIGRIGDPVRVVASGVVRRTARLPHYGKLIEVDHADGYATLYAHNDKIIVREGDVVKKGQIIALLGNSGRSTGPHLHFEIQKNGRRLDPMPYLRGARR